MSMEGEFVRFTSRARKQMAFVRDSIDAGYLDDIHRFEVLEKDHEYELAKRWREHGDRDAAHQLVTSHLRLAVRTAIGYRGYGMPISEIISEGNIALLQALIPNEVFALPLMRCGGSGLRYRITFCDRGRL